METETKWAPTREKKIIRKTEKRDALEISPSLNVENSYGFD